MEKTQSSAHAEESQPVLLQGLEAIGSVSEGRAEKEAEGEEPSGPVRLRKPQRNQVAMVVECVDDVVAADHPVRTVAAVVERLEVGEFSKPIKAREGVVGRDATDPGLLIALWLYACM